MAIRETKDDPVQQAADAAIRECAQANASGDRQMALSRVADELTRIRFELTATRKALRALAAKR